MKCPACKDVNLSIADRQGIEIDCCPECRGVWSDRGELDKILERSMSQQNPPKARENVPHQPRSHGQHDYQSKKKRDKSFLGELFDF